MPARIELTSSENGFSIKNKYDKELIDFIGEKLGRRVTLADKKNYAEINNSIKISNEESESHAGYELAQ